MKEKAKKVLLFVANPRLLLCFGIGWMITNGWSYIAFFLGGYFSIEWLSAIAAAYLAMLWFPFSPEKLVTLAIAMLLLRILFPNDEKTLGVLRDMKAKYLQNKPEEKTLHKDTKENNKE